MIGELKKVYLPGILVLCGVFSSPDSPGRDIDFNYACERKGETRYVQVVTEPGYACRVKYIKPSGTTFPWNARHDANYCGSKVTAFIEKLGAAGWECDSAEVVRSILLEQIERYRRYIESYNVVGKTCYFYPTEAQFGNLCGDEREEAAVVYTCEVDAGGWDQHLAVFLEVETEPLTSAVGRSGFRQVSSYHIDNNKVMMETEKISSTEDSNDAQYPLENTAMQCRYSASSKWELFEQP